MYPERRTHWQMPFHVTIYLFSGFSSRLRRPTPFGEVFLCFWERQAVASAPWLPSSTIWSVAAQLQAHFFLFADGSFLTRDLVREVRDALSRAGIDCSLYAGHSFRIGAATTAAKQKVPDSTIKMLGRWESAAYTQYIRTPCETLASISRVLLSDTS